MSTTATINIATLPRHHDDCPRCGRPHSFYYGSPKAPFRRALPCGQPFAWDEAPPVRLIAQPVARR